jgi:hypothetical protein
LKFESYLIETATTNWLRVPKWFQKGSSLIDLPDGIAMNVQASTGEVELHAKDFEGVYRFIGSFSVQAMLDQENRKTAYVRNKYEFNI